MSEILKKDGLSVAVLENLSYHSELGINLKKNLHYFIKEDLFAELERVSEWYDQAELLHDLIIDYRIKSIQSARLKYTRYYPDHQTGKVFNDMLGFRTLCDDYQDVLSLEKLDHIRVADLSAGKARDDGYRGVHVYFQLDHYHYPIEIQYNTYYDRQLNNWLHKYVYKKSYENETGRSLRTAYENGVIRTETEFKEVLDRVLFNSKKV